MSLVSVRYGQPQAVPALAHRLTLLSPSSSPLTQNLFKEAFFQDFCSITLWLNFLSPCSSVCVLLVHRSLSELAQLSRYYMPYLYYNTITFCGVILYRKTGVFSAKRHNLKPSFSTFLRRKIVKEGWGGRTVTLLFSRQKFV